MSVKVLGLTLVAVVGLMVAAWSMYQGSRYPCLSREPGLRGEVMRQADGTLVYFNGECWTTRFIAPTDTPL